MSEFPRHGCFAFLSCAWFSSLPNRPIVKKSGAAKQKQSPTARPARTLLESTSDSNTVSKANGVQKKRLGEYSMSTS